jgi:hypothetical protein
VQLCRRPSTVKFVTPKFVRAHRRFDDVLTAFNQSGQIVDRIFEFKHGQEHFGLLRADVIRQPFCLDRRLLCWKSDYVVRAGGLL